MQTVANKRGFHSFYTRGEEIFNAVSHIVGGAMGAAILIAGTYFARPDPAGMAAMAVFGVCVLILYTMSALYHFLPDGRAKGVFRIFDHCTIFLLIAGTYTPVCVIALGLTPIGIGVLIGEWVCAAAGITMNAIAMRNKVIKGLSMALYFVMGWAALLLLPLVLGRVPATSLWLLLFGGVSYTGGIIFFAFGKRVRYFHSVWHLFDLFGTLLQFLSILLLLL